MVKTYEEVDEFLVTTSEIEKIHGEIGKIPFHPLKNIKKKETFGKKSLIDARSMLWMKN